MGFSKHLNVVHVNHSKNTAGLPIIPMPVPEKVYIPMSQHIGAICEPLVSVGQQVAVGQCIGRSEARVSACIHASVSGTVTAIDGGTATLSVDHWYAGDGPSTVTVEAPSEDLQDLLMAVDFEQGKSYLVSATDTRVTLCGFTAERSPELEALYDEAFPQ